MLNRLVRLVSITASHWSVPSWEQLVAGDAGVVHQDVDRAALASASATIAWQSSSFGHVACDADEVLEAGGFHFLQPLVLVVELRVIEGHHLVTASASLADCRSEATHGAGNECDSLRHLFPFVDEKT
jgi:hypothetical protein